MKWARSATGNVCEYSTGYIGQHNYISISHTNYNNHYWYAYSVNGEEVLHGNFDAKNWDEAEQVAVKKIREWLSCRAEHWYKLWRDFNEEVNVNEKDS